MSFTKALYYPWIDIREEGWLKNAMLYWDKIQSIVPISVEQPYNTRTSQEFYDAGLLIPYHVEPGMTTIRELSGQVLKYLNSPEGEEVLMATEIAHSARGYSYIHPDKINREIRELVELHPDKLGYEIEHRLRDVFQSPRRMGWVTVDRRFASFYMTLLANNISEQTGTALLTDEPANNRLANKAKLDVTLIPNFHRYRHSHHYHESNQPSATLAQGKLAEIILERIQIDPDTSVQDILTFRNKHADKLANFRVKVAELTSEIEEDQPPEHLRQQVEDIYINQVRPAINGLKEGLSDCRIKWVTENLLKLTFFSTSPAFALSALGLSVPVALLVGVGISMTTSAILYNREKLQQLRENPFSYLLAVESNF